MFLRRLNYGNDLGSPVTLAWGGAKRLGGGAKGTLGQDCKTDLGRQSGGVTEPSPGEVLRLRACVQASASTRAPMGAPAPRVPAPALCLLLACARLSWGEPARESLEVPALGKRGVDQGRPGLGNV